MTLTRITSDGITDGSIVNADLHSAAEISGTKIADGTITNTKLNASAAIAGSKISPDFGSQNIVTTGTLNSGDITLTDVSPAINLVDSNNDSDFALVLNSGIFRIRDTTNSDADRLTIASDGNVDISQGLNVTGNLVTQGILTISSSNAILRLIDTNNDSDFRLRVDSGEFRIQDETNSQAVRFKIASDGTTTVEQNLNVGAGIDVTGNITVTGTVDGVDIAALNTTVGNITTDVVSDTSPQLGGSLDINGQDIVSTSNADIDIAPDGTGKTNFGGTTGIKLPIGTTAQRVNTEALFRYNSQTDLPEFYNGNAWIIIDQPPSITSVNNLNPTATQIAAGFDLVITGTNFKSGATVKFIGNDGTEHTSPTVTVNSSEQVTARIHTSVTSSNEPYDVKLTNASSLSNILEDAFNVNAQPAFTTSAGTIATINDTATGTHATLAATDPESDAVTFSGTVGGGLTLASNGIISGNPTDVTSSTTLSFTATATDSVSNTSTRTFNIIVNPALDGSSAAKATANPTALFNDTGINTSGTYWIKANGFNSGNAVQAYFDFIGNEGYLMIVNYLHQGGTAPGLVDRTNSSLPQLGSSSLGVNESGTSNWGHITGGTSGGVGSFGTVDMVRWYAKTNAHGRVIHFKNNNAGTVNYCNTGSGSNSGINSGFTTLSGHSAGLPGSANITLTGFTGFAFYQNSSRHWGLGGSRWEVDDFHRSSSYHTLHRVFARYA